MPRAHCRALNVPTRLPQLTHEDTLARAWWYPDISKEKNPHKLHEEILSFRSLWNDHSSRCRDWTFEKGFECGSLKPRNPEEEDLAPDEIAPGVFVHLPTRPAKDTKKRRSWIRCVKGSLHRNSPSDKEDKPLEEKKSLVVREKFKRIFEQPVLS